MNAATCFSFTTGTPEHWHANHQRHARRHVFREELVHLASVASISFHPLFPSLHPEPQEPHHHWSCETRVRGTMTSHIICSMFEGREVLRVSSRVDAGQTCTQGLLLEALKTILPVAASIYLVHTSTPGFRGLCQNVTRNMDVKEEHARPV